MYRRRTYRRKKRPYTTRKRVRNYRRKVKLTKTIGPPGYIYAKLKYSSTRNVNVAVSTMDNRAFALNSVYDPDISGTGNQPYYHDQYSAMFQRYRVFGAKVVWKVAVASSSSYPFMPTVAMVPYIGTPSWGYDMDTIISSKGVVWKIVSTNSGPAVFKRYYSIASVAGVSKKTVQDDDAYQALTNASPSSLAQVSFVLQNRDASNTITYTSEVQITYYVKYFQNVNPGAS